MMRAVTAYTILRPMVDPARKAELTRSCCDVAYTRVGGPAQRAGGATPRVRVYRLQRAALFGAAQPTQGQGIAGPSIK